MESKKARTEGDKTVAYDAQRQQALRIRDHMAALRSKVAVAESKDVPGLLYMENFLMCDEEHSLMTHIDSSPWLSDLRRRVQHYGWRYNYRERMVHPDDYIGPLPEWMVQIVRRLVATNIIDKETVIDQAIVNEYLPGQGIAAHIDQPSMFGREVVTISMGSAVTMDFSRGDATHHIRLHPCSVARLREDARYKWTHAIPSRKSDPGPCSRVPRGRRVSLTFRGVKR